MSSPLPLLGTCIILYYMLSSGSLHRVIWLSLNTVDTLRALRSARPNGRRIGLLSRRKVIREALVCWIVFVAAQTVGSVPDRLLGWLPLYGTLRTIICGIFLSSRVVSSATIYTSSLTPFLRRYEAPIDLTFLLFQTLSILIGHYLIRLPLETVWRGLPILTSTAIRFGSFFTPVDYRSVNIGTDRARTRPDAMPETTPGVASSPSHLRQSAARIRGPRLRVVSPERPRSGPRRRPSPAITVSDSDDELPRPSTPPPTHQRTKNVLLVPTASSLRRSPRKRLEQRETDDRLQASASGPILDDESGFRSHISPSSTSGRRPAKEANLLREPFDKPSSRSAPTVRSANLPLHSANLPLQPAQAAKGGSPCQLASTLFDVVDIPGPSHSSKEASLPRGCPTSSSALRDPLTVPRRSPPSSRITAGSVRTKVIRPRPQSVAVGPIRGSTSSNRLYPKLPGAVPPSTTPIPADPVKRAIQRSTVAPRDRTVRLTARTTETGQEKVGEKRRAVTGLEGERRPTKRGKVEVRADR